MLRRVLFLLSLAAPALLAQTPKPAGSPQDGLDAWIAGAMAKAKGVGLAIAIVKNDSVVYAKGFGVKKLGDPAAVTPHTLFAIGSTTKAFTAAALGMLVDEGKLAWDDKVIDRLPGFELLDPAVTREMTIRDLLTHRSGLSRGDRLWEGSNLSRAEVIRRVRLHRPSWGFRTRWGYNNIMFLTAGQIIPAVAGTTWDDFLKERIFTPLGMTSTNTSVRSLTDHPDVAAPHGLRNGRTETIPYRVIDNIGPAGSINSNVLDMAQWIRLHLNGGAAGGKTLIKPATEQELVTPQMWIADPEGLGFLYEGSHFLGYGLGWFLFDRSGRKIVEHSGGIDGMVTELIMVPEERLGVIVLTNSAVTPIAFAVGHTVIDRYLGLAVDRLTPILAGFARVDGGAQAIEDSLEKTRNKASRPTLALTAYTGTFDNPMYGPARIDLENDRLVIRIQALVDPLKLDHWQYDSFRGVWGDPEFGKAFATFRLTAAGGVDGVTIDGVEQEFVRRPAAVAALACEPSDVDQSRLASRRSPYDSAAVHVGTNDARVCYSRPSMRGRAVFGAELVPYDTLWRTGANDPTIIHLPFAAEIAGIKVKPGKYSIYTVPGKASWTVVVNASTSQGGLTRDEGQFKNDYTDVVRGQEVGRATVPAEAIAEPVEKFTIRSEARSADRADLVLEWEKTRIRIPIKTAAGPATGR